MSGSLSVLFGLSKALRCGNSEDFVQQYDTLVKQAELSDYMLLNHKEAIRQISELEDGDFSLLECAVAEPLSAELGHQASAVPLHIGLKVEDLEEVSIAEQLENLLEKLRMDAVGHISTDSGTVSDVDSPKNTLEEDQMKTSEKVSPLDVCGTASGTAQLSGESPGTDGHIQNSCKRYRVVSSNSHSLEKHTPRERRRRGDRVEDGRSKPKENALQLKHPQAPGHRPTVARGRAIQQVPHKEGHQELDMKMERPTEAQPDQQECSVAEGGPFITHWGKGRWKRNGGRDWNRKSHNSHHSLSRQRFSTPGGSSRPRYHTRTHHAAEHTTLDKHSSHNYRKQVTAPKGDLPGPQNKTKVVTFEREVSPTCQQKAPSPKPTVSTVPATQNTVPSTLSEKTQKRLTYASIAGSSKPSVAAQPRAHRTTADILRSNQAIAASFNYTEVVQFLWTSWQEAQSRSKSRPAVQ